MSRYISETVHDGYTHILEWYALSPTLERAITISDINTIVFDFLYSFPLRND